MTMGEIIEGVQFQIEANELEELLTKKTNHHAKKYEQYTLQYENMQRDKEERSQENPLEPRSSYSPVEAAFEKMVHHRSEMKKYDYLRRHVIAGAKYRVTYSDLSRLIV